jgi:N-acetyl-anhydromuramyl-L-alanine amidase AmpD
MRKSGIFQGSARHPVREIAVHCTATQPLFMHNSKTSQKVAEIRRWHVEDRGWRDIGYHYLIDRDGTVARGRAESMIGAGIEGHNRGVLHISLFGGYGSKETDAFSKNFTPSQDTALRALIADIQRRADIKKISGHCDYAAKACPGFQVREWLAGAPK